MKKSGLYIIICILIIVVVSGCAYLFISKQSNNKDSIKLLSTKKRDDKIIQEYEIILNGKKKTLNIDFKEETDMDSEVPEMNFKMLKGTFNNKELYYYSNGIEKYDSSLYTIEGIKNSFNENNFEIIKGEDNKNYLVITSYISSLYVGNSYIYYIYNDDLELINDDEENYFEIVSDSVGFEVENNKHVFYENKNYKLINDVIQVRCKIENNKIYLLEYVLDSDDKLDDGVFEEREYTINNSKLDYKVINKYKAKVIAGQL